MLQLLSCLSLSQGWKKKLSKIRPRILLVGLVAVRMHQDLLLTQVEVICFGSV